MLKKVVLVSPMWPISFAIYWIKSIISHRGGLSKLSSVSLGRFNTRCPVGGCLARSSCDLATQLGDVYHGRMTERFQEARVILSSFFLLPVRCSKCELSVAVPAAYHPYCTAMSSSIWFCQPQRNLLWVALVAGFDLSNRKATQAHIIFPFTWWILQNHCRSWMVSGCSFLIA